jgi:hypothetical protein
MNKITTFLLAGLALVAGPLCSTHAASAGGLPSGTLGQRYGELSFGVADLQHVSPNFYDLSFGGNLPLTRELDLGANFGHGWFGGHTPGTTNALGTGLTFHRPLSGPVQGFASAGLGYQWWNDGGGDGGFWNAAVGVQIPVGSFTLTPRLVYTDDFRRPAHSSQQLAIETEANVWLSQYSAVFATIGYSDARHSRVDAWTGRIGYRFGF